MKGTVHKESTMSLSNNVNKDVIPKAIQTAREASKKLKSLAAFNSAGSTNMRVPFTGKQLLPFTDFEMLTCRQAGSQLFGHKDYSSESVQTEMRPRKRIFEPI